MLTIRNKPKEMCFHQKLGCSEEDDGSGGPVLPFKERKDDESLSLIKEIYIISHSKTLL